MEDKSYVESKLGAPTWLSGAVQQQQVRASQQGTTNSAGSSFVNEATQQQQSHDTPRKWCGCEAGGQCVQCSFMHLSGGGAGGGGSSVAGNGIAMTANHNQQHSAAEAAGLLAIARSGGDLAQSGQGGRGNLLDLHSDTANSSDLVEGEHGGGEHGGGGHNQQDSQVLWQNARLKADITMHPLYDQLLAAHVACLRIATPVDQLPRIDAQIAQASQIVAKYAVLGQNNLLVGEEKDELDQFMAHYVLLLCTFKEQLQQHVKVHAMEAVMACWELEQSLLTLTGVSPGEGTGATMSDDDDDPAESDPSIYDPAFDTHDSGAFGPLIPTETERTLMERVRQELKNELKNGYKDRIVDVREEILRKRRAGKLPGDTTSVLKAWWHAHSKWPYPTEDEKARLVQETGLQLKQINNWFINQRKRNWHSNPSSTAAMKTKRKR
ncbi:hypothetical protein KP509_13G020400 [Ceratopteris richardii]|uniref:CRKNOX3 n=2 Tax=Ceratopteris richardii TaxID=49495 RepID=Q9FRX8_CERRI|nr:hypothetical protein KP509_13G020400 [Ceratopteris richardii]BAB18585.1 CRKNOX3 [Ceratopteris richardii]